MVILQYGGELTDPSVWTKIVIVLVKVVDCISDLPLIVKGRPTHKVKLLDIYRLAQLFF